MAKESYKTCVIEAVLDFILITNFPIACIALLDFKNTKQVVYVY